MYFAHRHQAPNAEDLAHETMLAVLSRDDYHFEKQEDFLRVCYAFARNTAKASKRREDKHAASDLEEVQIGIPRNHAGKATENEIFLREVIGVGETRLEPKEWEAIRRAAEPERANLHNELGFENANAFRVFLHRARKKLAALTGYRR